MRTPILGLVLLLTAAAAAQEPQDDPGFPLEPDDASLMAPGTHASWPATADFESLSLPDLALHADAIVLASGLQVRRDFLRLPVREYLLGHGPQDVYVPNRAIAAELAETDGGDDWIVFLAVRPEGLAAIGALAGSTVPLDGAGRRATGSDGLALPPGELTALVRELVACRGASGERPMADLVLRLCSAGVESRRLVGFQLASEARPAGGRSHAAVRVATAFLPAGLRDGSRTQWAARRFSDVAPPAGTLRRLLAERRQLAEDDSAAQGMLAGATLEVALAFAGGVARDPMDDVLVNSECLLGLEDFVADRWFGQAWPRLLARDAELIAQAIASDLPSDHAAAARWLHHVADTDFGLGAATDAAARAAALAAFEAWRATGPAP